MCCEAKRARGITRLVKKEEGKQMKGRRDGDEEVVWLTVLLLFSMEAEEHKAPLVRRPSCWDLDPIIKRLGYPLGAFLTLHHYTSHLSCSDPLGVLFAPYLSHNKACAFRHICSLLL